MNLADLLGPCIRRLDSESGQIYLTFDDGPHVDCTPAVLDILERHGAKATFFVIAERAVKQPRLIATLQACGHGIGNHSLDHRFGPFFSRRETLKTWIHRSESLLTELLGAPPVGFRSPAGVRTPPLHWALAQLNLPLVHWNIRFFDTSRLWTTTRAFSSLAKTSTGSIILLHDTHEGERRRVFLETLDRYLGRASEQGFRFAALDRELVRSGGNAHPSPSAPIVTVSYPSDRTPGLSEPR